MGRNREGIKHNPGHGRIQIGQTIFIGLIGLALFHDQYEFSKIRSLISSLFFIVVNLTMSNMFGTILTFQNERPVFLREQANKMYSVSAYYMAKIVAEIPILTFTPMLFSCIIYFKIGLSITATQFFLFFLTVLLNVQCAASFGYLISSIFESEETAVAIAPIIMLPIILFGGQFANSGDIQAWISWFQYISPIRYGLEALCRNEFDSRTYNDTAIFEHLTMNNTKTIFDAMANPEYYADAANSTYWQEIQAPEVNPRNLMDQNVGLWQSLLILASLALALRIMSLYFMKKLVSKFQ